MSLFPKPIEKEAEQTGEYIDGNWTPADIDNLVDGNGNEIVSGNGENITAISEFTNSPITFYGSVQPLTGKEIKALQIGRIDLGKVKVYTNTRLNVTEQGGNRTGDIIYWDSRKWELIDEQGNRNQLISHYKYIAEYRGLIEE